MGSKVNHTPLPSFFLVFILFPVKQSSGFFPKLPLAGKYTLSENLASLCVLQPEIDKQQ